MADDTHPGASSTFLLIVGDFEIRRVSYIHLEYGAITMECLTCVGIPRGLRVRRSFGEFGPGIRRGHMFANKFMLRNELQRADGVLNWLVYDVSLFGLQVRNVIVITPRVPGRHLFG